MKNLKKITLLTLITIAFVSCKNENMASTANEDDTTTLVASENLASASFTIEGMSCPEGCAKVIENKLAGLNGVTNAKVDFENKKATVTFDNAKQTPETLAETVEAVAGGKLYKVSDVKSSTDKAFYNVKEKDKKKKRNSKKEAAAKEETTTTTEKSVEKKSCCSGKSSCGEKKESGTL